MLAVLLASLIASQPIIVRAHGTATIGADGTGSCAGSTTADLCRRAAVTAVGTTAVNIDLKVAVPSVTSIGTVVFLNGGGATAYTESAGASAATMITTLKADGFTVIQTACAAPTGGSATGCNVNPSGGGLKTAAGRIPTLIDAIDADSALHLSGTPICVVGQSGGGVLAAYGMVHYGMGSKVDLLITTGGPSMTREDYHCEGRTNTAWSAILDARQLSGTGGGAAGIPSFTDDAFGFNGAAGPCAWQTNRGNVPWRQDSIISDGADYRLPNTKWIFTFGASDTVTIVVPMARLLEDQIAAFNGGSTCASGSNTACAERTVAATPHAVASTANGTAQIRSDLLADCINR